MNATKFTPSSIYRYFLDWVVTKFVCPQRLNIITCFHGPSNFATFTPPNLFL